MADAPLTLSVVLISWNQLAQLRLLVDQLLDQDFPRAHYEIIVVDDGSTDGTREWLANLRDDSVRRLFGSANAGRSASRNRGIEYARGRVIIMVDGDHTVRRNFLAIHAERHARQRCVIVGKSDFVDRPRYRALNHYLNNGGAAKLREGSQLPGRYFLTRNCSVPRDLLLQVGLFDERFMAWGGEDLELGKRLEKTGVPIFAEPRAIAIHHHLRPLPDLLNQLYVYGRDAVPLLLERHPELFSELNLDHAVALPDLAGRFGALHRRAVRLIFCSPVYGLAKAVAQVLTRRRLPRVLFDYLFLRQYTRGYLRFLNKQHTRG